MDNHFEQKQMESWGELEQELQNLLKSGEKKWLFRGQSSNWGLETTLERYMRRTCFDLVDTPGIEAEMIRNFQRLYSGDDRKDVVEDKLYCISLMRHYGAPCRLLDFTYSKEVAMYFGIESAFDAIPTKKDAKPNYEAKRGVAIWCVNFKYTDGRVKETNKELYDRYFQRSINDKERNDETFVPLYMENKGAFVLSENPIRLHQRLDIQHGAHLCPGNVAKSFWDNLAELIEDDHKSDVIKLTCEIGPSDLCDLLEQFRLKSITRQSLLPGPDGFAQSMKYKLPMFNKIRKNREDTAKQEKKDLTY